MGNYNPPTREQIIEKLKGLTPRQLMKIWQQRGEQHNRKQIWLFVALLVAIALAIRFIGAT